MSRLVEVEGCGSRPLVQVLPVAIRQPVRRQLDRLTSRLVSAPAEEVIQILALYRRDTPATNKAHFARAVHIMCAPHPQLAPERNPRQT